MKNTFFSISPYHENIVKSRYDYNRQIINLLSEYIEKYPEIRFGQLLVDLECVVDSQLTFYEEPKDMLERMREPINKHKI